MSQPTNKPPRFVAPGFVDLDNLDHAPDLAASLGNMVVAWARAETAIVKTYALVSKLHYNEAAAAYYAIPTFESRTKTLMALAEEINSQKPITHFDEIVAAIGSLVDLSKTRNAWIHGVWVCRKGSNLVHTFNMKQSPKTRRPKQITANAVREHTKAVRAQSRALEALSPVKIELRS